MMNFLGLSRDRVPHAKLDDARFVTFFDLDIGELMAFGALVIVMPLVAIGLRLPFLPWLLTVISFPCWAFCLFFVKHEGHNAAYWIGKMVPFWLRQHSFRLNNRQIRITPRHELIDAVLTSGVNSLFFEWRNGADGELELHIYEEPLRPYRAWITAGGTPIDHAPVKLPS